MIKIPRMLIVVGAMKAGTSFLYDLLRENPQIETIPINEVNYFPHVHTSMYNITHGLRLHHLKIYSAHCEVGRSVQQIQKDVTFFSRYLRDPVDDNWFKNLYQSDARTFKAEFSNIISLLEPDALRHIRKTVRRIKIVYVIRDPLLRLWSHTKFHNSFEWREEKKMPLETMSASQYTTLIKNLGHHRHGQYTENIKRFLKVFDEREIKIVFYEDLVSDAKRTLLTLCDFLGIPPHEPAADKLVTPVNVGPALAMPDAFLEAARPFVQSEFVGLPGLGVQPHSAWQPV